MAAHPSWIFFLATWLILGCKTVVAQVSVQNPLIWQTLVSPYSSNNFDYVSDSTSKYYSQDFQTVFAYSDNYGHNERLLIIAGDGCHDLTLDTVASYNNGLSSFIKRQPVMGLVARGGGCTWSTKINTMKTLVLHNSNLDMTGVLIYDNVTNDNAVVQRLMPSQQLASNYWNSTTLTPPQRNISNMLDNDLGTHANVSDNSNYMATYFIPHGFAMEMLGKMNNTNSHYVMLAPYFSDSVMKDNPSNDNTGGNGSTSSDSSGDTDSLFGYGNRGYIAYLIAAGAAILLAVILFRWCRSPRFGLGRYRQRSQNDPEQQQQQVALGAFPPSHHHPQQAPPPPCVPIEKLDIMCPAQPGSLVFPQMKNTVCAVCLDDFKATSILRLLPCHHGFCVACIDFWLTKKSSLCPICKYDCAAEEDDLGKMHSPPPPASSSSTSPPPPPTSTPATTNNNNNALSDVAEHDLGTHSPSPPPYVQSQPTTSPSTTTPSEEPTTRTLPSS